MAEGRLADVDALRGFALAGILMVNLTAFASPFYGAEIADPDFAAPLDLGVRFVVAALFETKFYLLFSFLFGYSFTLQMQAGAQFAGRMLRRLGALWALGAAHAVFLFRGDILTTYAVLGLALLRLRNRPDRWLVRLAVGLVAVTATGWALLACLQACDPQSPGLAALLRARAAQAAFAGTAGDVVAQNLRELATTWVVLALLQAPCALAMFALGLVAGRRQWLARPHRMQWHRLLWVGLPGAALYAAGAVFLPGTPLGLAGLAVGLATAPFLAGAYVGALRALFLAPAGVGLRDLLAPAGRMALSNYLLQSLAGALVFHGYGLGLIGRVAPAVTAAICVAIFSGQVVFSGWWMARHAYGPMEWLLRAITVLAWPAWRRPVAP